MSNYRATINQSLFGKVVQNVTHWQLPDTATATKQGFVDALRASYVSNIATRLANNWTLESVTLRLMEGGGPFSEEFSFTLGVLNGGSVADCLPTQLSLLASLIYAGPRPNRGRVYIAGCTETDQTDSNWESVLKTAAADLVISWKNGLDTGFGNAFLRIARPNEALNQWTLNNPVTSVIVRDRPATQRRRRLAA